MYTTFISVNTMHRSLTYETSHRIPYFNGRCHDPFRGVVSGREHFISYPNTILFNVQPFSGVIKAQPKSSPRLNQKGREFFPVKITRGFLRRHLTSSSYMTLTQRIYHPQFRIKPWWNNHWFSYLLVNDSRQGYIKWTLYAGVPVYVPRSTETSLYPISLL